jgi:DMSO/TMAO reductase YedYZ molybdopterin-dependent catalytic subunit
MTTEPDWLHGHAHEPNPEPPDRDPDITLVRPDGTRLRIAAAELAAMPPTVLAGCRIASTGHPSSGPFAFAGVPLGELIRRALPETAAWRHVDVLGRDGFGTRVRAEETDAALARPPLLCLAVDGRALSRAEGLVRLIVPSEAGDALRQVKWVAELRVAGPEGPRS